MLSTESVHLPALLDGGSTTISTTMFSWDISNSCSTYLDNAKLCSTLDGSVKSSFSFTSGTRKCVLLLSVCVCDPGIQPRPLTGMHHALLQTHKLHPHPEILFLICSVRIHI